MVRKYFKLILTQIGKYLTWHNSLATILAAKEDANIRSLTMPGGAFINFAVAIRDKLIKYNTSLHYTTLFSCENTILEHIQVEHYKKVRGVSAFS